MAHWDGTFPAPQYFVLRHTVWQTAQEVANNRSLVRSLLQIIKTTSSNPYNLTGSATWSINVGGNTAGSSFTYDFRGKPLNAVHTVDDRSYWITHNHDGTRSISCSSSVNGGGAGALGAASTSGTLGLATIPRFALDRFDGSIWRDNFLERWTGSSWRVQRLERFTGASWVRQG